jgi:hypothetical protein
MRRLVYRSLASQRFGLQALMQMLVDARGANAKAGITGALVYQDGTFFQVIEGEHAAIAALMERIARDDRHEGIQILIDEAVDARRFVGWRMGLVEFDALATRWSGRRAAPSALLEVVDRDDCLALIDTLCDGVPVDHG